jgi:site-specific DNA-methyltransferase (adenine-specific)
MNGLQRTRLVADPFLGLGSTAVACAQLGLSFIGIEMDEGYLNEAVERTRAALERPATIARTNRRQ